MINDYQKISLSEEQILLKYSNGIKIITPPQDTTYKNDINEHLSSLTVKEILALPVNIYFLDIHSRMQTINAACAATMGFSSINDSLYKTMFDISPSENAQNIIKTDIQVVQNNALRIIEDEVILFDGSIQNFLSIKLPYYNKNNKIIGIFGCSIKFGEQPFAQPLIQIAQLGLLNLTKKPLSSPSFATGLIVDNTYITKRQKEILYHLTRGSTAKIISKKLNLSIRTVEQHIFNIKNKLNVKNKSGLIEKAIFYLYPSEK